MKKSYLCLLLFCNQVSYADVMNLNEYMPTRLEDASPIDEKTSSLQLSSAFEENGKEDRLIHRPNIRYGASKQLQLDVMSTIYSGVDEDQSGEIDIGGLYQFWISTNWVPVLAINPLFTFPTGKGSKGEDFQYKVLLTSTINGTPDAPITQLHLNMNHSYNDQEKPGERLNQFLYAIGFSHRLSPNTALIVDYLCDEEEVAEIGLHQSLSGGFQAGVGFGAGLNRDSPSWSWVFGIEKEF